MAAPVYQSASTGSVWTTGAAVATSLTTTEIGSLVVLHVLVDGTSGLGPTLSSITNISDLAGTSGAMTQVGSYAVGSGGEYQWIFAGRATATAVCSVSATQSSGNDMYFRLYAFSGASTGTTVASVFADIGNYPGTSTNLYHSNCTASGADNLGLLFIAVNDDNALGSFINETGGDWQEVAEFASATGTDGNISLQKSAMATNATISGGGYTMSASDAWSCMTCMLLPASSVDNRNANVVNTGGGIYTPSARHGGLRSVASVGGGVVAVAPSGQHNKAVANTGGGVYTPSARHGGLLSVALTGGGVATVVGEKGVPKAAEYSAVLTGGGVAAPSVRKGGASSVVDTGGGVVVLTRVPGRQSSVANAGGGVLTMVTRKGGIKSVVDTGGGVVSTTTRKGGLISVTAAGGGVAVPTPSGAHNKSVASTGGGVVVITAERTGGSEAHEVSVAATGGGAYTPANRKGMAYSHIFTGGGIFTPSVKKGAIRSGAFTGGGVLTNDGRKGMAYSHSLTGGGIVTLAGRKGMAYSHAMTGGGVVNIFGTKRAISAVPLTGGGVVVLLGRKGAASAPSDTGGGVATLDLSKQAFNSVAATGAGVATLDIYVVGGASVSITGGGTATVDAWGGRESSVQATGGGVVVTDGVRWQPTVLAGFTRDNSGAPLPFCTVDVYRTDDHVFIGSVQSDGLGHYSIEVDPATDYFAVGYIGDRVGVSQRAMQGVA